MFIDRLSKAQGDRPERFLVFCLDSLPSRHRDRRVLQDLEDHLGSCDDSEAVRTDEMDVCEHLADDLHEVMLCQ